MGTDKKYKLTEEYITIGNRKLYRIEALKDFSNVKKGDKGGFVESEKNLAQYGNCWIYNDAKVYDNACVYDDAIVCDYAQVYNNVEIDNKAKVKGSTNIYDNAVITGNALIYGEARIGGNTIISNNAEVYETVIICGDAHIFNNAKITSNLDYIVFKNWWSSGRYFTWTRSNNMWSVGCFYGTGEELIAKAYKDSELSGREYERVVKYVETIMNENLNLMNSYKYHPKTREELQEIIKQRIEDEGNEVDLNDIDVSRITDMSHLFEESSFNGNISKWDVSNVTDMAYMFDHCEKFNQDISNWDVSNVTDMWGMFARCEKFNQDISKWDVSKVKYMNFIFYNCPIKDEYKPKF